VDGAGGVLRQRVDVDVRCLVLVTPSVLDPPQLVARRGMVGRGKRADDIRRRGPRPIPAEAQAADIGRRVTDIGRRRRPRPELVEARATGTGRRGVLDLDLVAVAQGDAGVHLSPARAAHLHGAARRRDPEPDRS
jgi:hypothetical protein